MLEPFAHSPLGKASSRETSVNEPSSPMPKDSWKSGLLKAAIKREKNLTGLQPLRDLAIQIDRIVQLTFLDELAFRMRDVNRSRTDQQSFAIIVGNPSTVRNRRKGSSSGNVTST
jgi:hypothetical protein